MIRCVRPAMATLFEAYLVGSDEEHLAAVGEAALDEVSRVERLLSRHDHAAELARVNREAARGPVRVDRELFGILGSCRHHGEQTDGFFDPSAPSGWHYGEVVRLDPEARTVQLLEPGASIDLGGFGKGYALDLAAKVLDEFSVGSALLHGGTSSILARGRPEGDPAWRVGIRDPFDPDPATTVTRLSISNCGVASSAVFDPGAAVSDVIDPALGKPLDRQEACTVIAPSAVEAEVFSTALLAMGRRRTVEFLQRGSDRLPNLRVAWVARDRGQTVIDWFSTERVR